MNDSSVIVALLSLVGTLIGSIAGVLVSNKLTNYRIEQLEKKLDEYAVNMNDIKEWKIKTDLLVQALHKRMDSIVQQLHITEIRE